jgi:hypothetical protein
MNRGMEHELKVKKLGLGWLPGSWKDGKEMV